MDSTLAGSAATALSIEQEIEIHASPERVYAAWTDPEQLLAWWGDDSTYLTTAWEADLRVGGKWLSRGRMADGKDFSVQGEYLRVEPPTYLTFTWISDWDSANTVVALEFHPTGSGTLLKLTHTGFTSEQSRNGHNQGWQRVCNWMRNYVESHK